MRCAACGSKKVVTDISKEGYSVSKGIIGTAILGSAGAVMGVNAKNKTYYHCLECGQVLSDSMDLATSGKIDVYMIKPEEYKFELRILKEKYPNIEWDENEDKDSNKKSEWKRETTKDFKTRTEEDIANAILEYYNKIKVPYLEYTNIMKNVLKGEEKSRKLEEALKILEERGIIKYDEDSPTEEKCYIFYDSIEDIKKNIKDRDEKKKLEKRLENEKKRNEKKIAMCKKMLKEYENKKIIEELEKNLEKYIKEWQEEVEEINIKMEEKINQYTEKKNEELQLNQAQLRKEEQKKIDKINIEINKLEEENNKCQDEIKKLKALNFIKKGQINDKIQENEEEVIKYKDKIKELNVQFDDKLKNMSQKVQDQVCKYRKEIKAKYICPNNPEELIDDIKDNLNISLTNEKIEIFQKEEILYNIFINEIREEVTIKELMSHKSIIENVTNSDKELLDLLKNMENEDRIIEKEGKYTLNEEVVEDKKKKYEDDLSHMTKGHVKNYKIKKRIYNELITEGPITIVDLMIKSDIINNMVNGSNHKISELMVQLLHENKVERIEKKGKVYFKIKEMKNIDEGIDTKFAIDRKKVYEYLYDNNRKSISELMLEFKELLPIRVIQVLESLRKEKIIRKKVIDAAIYYYMN